MPHTPGAPRRAAPLATAARVQAARAVGTRTTGAFAGAALVLLASALLTPARTAAQPVLGPGDDASIPAPGQVRVRTQLTFGAARDRAGGRTGGSSGRVVLGTEYGLDSLTTSQLPGLTAARDALRLATGATGLGLSLGTLGVRARLNTSTLPVLTEVGLTRRLAFSVTIPYTQTRTLVDLVPNAGGGSGNFGLNPAVGTDPAAVAARAQTDSALAHLTAAATAARSNCPTESAAANCATARALATTAEQVRTQLASIYGFSTSTAGLVVVPLANSDAQRAVAQRYADLAAQFAAVGVAFNGGVLPAPSRARVGLPGLLTLLNTTGYGVARSNVVRPLQSLARGGRGDVEVAASFQLVNGFGGAARDGAVRARVAPTAGLRVRSTVTGGFRFATGLGPSSSLLYQVAPSERSAAVLARSATDFAFGRRASASVVARVALPLADQITIRIPLAEGEPFAPAYAAREVDRHLGRELELEVTPRYALGESFAFAAQGVLRDRRAAEFTGRYELTAAETGGDPVTLDATALGVGTGGREAQVGLGASYSTLAAYRRGRSRLPLEVSYLHRATASASGGAVPYVTTDQLSVRLYVRLLGR